MPEILNSAGAAIIIGLMVLITGGNCQSNNQNGKPHGENKSKEISQGGEKNLQNLIKSVLNKDPSAAILAQKIGPSANPELIKLTQNNDPDVRFIALGCLNETGGEGAAQTFVKALLDIDESVHNVAIQGLMNHPDPAVYNDLLNAYDKSDDVNVKRMVPMIAADLESTVKIEDIKSRYLAEKDSTVIEGCIVALAKLGDAQAQKEFIERLNSSAGQKRQEYLDLCEYISAPWLLKPLIPLLSDKEEMVFIGLDGQPQLPQSLRTCDIVVELVATISGKEFSFPVGGPVNYSDQQLDEVREFLRQK